MYSLNHGFICVCVRRCKPLFMPVEDDRVCVPIVDCSIDQCGEHGTCYMYDGRFRCRCDEGWSGERCDIRAEPVVGGAVLTTWAIIAIVICILVLLCKYMSILNHGYITKTSP